MNRTHIRPSPPGTIIVDGITDALRPSGILEGIIRPLSVPRVGKRRALVVAWISVDAPARGNGVAKAMLKRAVKAAKTQGIRYISAILTWKGAVNLFQRVLDRPIVVRGVDEKGERLVGCPSLTDPIWSLLPNESPYDRAKQRNDWDVAALAYYKV